MEKIVTAPRIDFVVAPASIVVVGASASRGSATGNQVIRNLRAAGFSGRIEIAHPSGAIIEGITSSRDLTQLSGIDLAVVAVSPAGVLGALRDAHTAGIPAALVMSVGAAPSDLTAMSEFSRATGMVVHGPNCMGIVNASDGAMIWADEGILMGLPRGDVSLISQSGSGAIFVARSMSGVGFAKVISTGNEAATTTADYLRYLATDASTEVIGVIVESIGSAGDFADAVRHVRAYGKVVVALKVGRSEAGAAATVAHTGAVLADDAIVTAFFERIGVPLVRDYDELASALELLSHTKRLPFRDGRTAVLTISGGQAALAADLAGERNTPLAGFSEETVARLRGILPGVHPNNPLDAGGSTEVEEGYFLTSLRAVEADPGVDVIVAIVDAQSSLGATEIEYEDDLFRAVHEAAAASQKPFVIASSSSLSIHPARIPRPGAGVPVIRGIANAFEAIRASVVALRESEATPERPNDLPDAALVHQLKTTLASTNGTVEYGLATQILEAYGLPMVRARLARTLDEALEQARTMTYPLVLKIASPDIAHRSDIGGVVTGITHSDELGAAWERISTAVSANHPHARIAGMEIQEEIGASIEAFVGSVSDPRLGSTVGVGLGGVWVELLKDAAHGFAPLSPSQAGDMLRRTKLHDLLRGHRNLHPLTDTDPLVDVIVRVSWMMEDLGSVIGECDFNPVLIAAGSGRAVLIDCLIVSRGSGD